MNCRICSAPAVAVYAFDAGCVCYPDDREQALCAQHVQRSSPLGSMVLIHGDDIFGSAWTTIAEQESRR